MRLLVVFPLGADAIGLSLQLLVLKASQFPRAPLGSVVGARGAADTIRYAVRSVPTASVCGET